MTDAKDQGLKLFPIQRIILKAESAVPSFHRIKD